ncbi:UNVERIFIED_ORG: hypothetical protein M2435_005419 [Rhizobium sophorae]|uniref:Riboflavin biosynthesis protein n=1 Tax=Rhizobium leguminosarum bv. trifolii TaxID=386 RepID=A0A1C9HNC5_RHILT|nr:riboflavin biosynthesis protein [Rhizobium leguminosarum bv. trifolii]MBB4525416.1 hypothetical protein [Rhizobium leguminosarum]MDH6662489.1 hypothetical protein [Rhizobium sophorae]
MCSASPSKVGAVICGRKCYDDSIPYWDENGPTGPLKLPLFVVTHRPLLASHSTGIYRAAGSIPDAVKQAKSAAGGKDVSLMGGASLAIFLANVVFPASRGPTISTTRVSDIASATPCSTSLGYSATASFVSMTV